ncbi:hypothetical protein JCM9534A_56740 [Catenuloplanes indicus JCM 9534]
MAVIEVELALLAPTRQTPTKILKDRVSAAEPAGINEPANRSSPCLQPRLCPACEGRLLRVGIGTEPKDAEGIRAKS